VSEVVVAVEVHMEAEQLLVAGVDMWGRNRRPWRFLILYCMRIKRGDLFI
jgi:hypothetical protein